MPGESIEIYTDGSCHTQYRVGAWVAIILAGMEKKLLSEIVKDTTHNRMELLAVIKAIEYVKAHYPGIRILKVYTDSQYVTGLTTRKEKLLSTDFITTKGAALQNADLIKAFFKISSSTVEVIKVKAHQKNDDMVNYNREADMLARKLLRNAVEEISPTWML